MTRSPVVVARVRLLLNPLSSVMVLVCMAAYSTTSANSPASALAAFVQLQAVAVIRRRGRVFHALHLAVRNHDDRHTARIAQGGDAVEELAPERLRFHVALAVGHGADAGHVVRGADLCRTSGSSQSRLSTTRVLNGCSSV